MREVVKKSFIAFDKPLATRYCMVQGIYFKRFGLEYRFPEWYESCNTDRANELIHRLPFITEYKTVFYFNQIKSSLMSGGQFQLNFIYQ